MAKKRKPPVIPGNSMKYIHVRNSIKQSELSFQRNFARQFVIDAACLAVHDTFGAGEKRMADFLLSLHENLMKMADLTLEDAQDDKSLVYMKAKLDEALKPILGINFKPYDERYSQ